MSKCFKNLAEWEQIQVLVTLQRIAVTMDTERIGMPRPFFAVDLCWPEPMPSKR